MKFQRLKKLALEFLDFFVKHWGLPKCSTLLVFYMLHNSSTAENIFERVIENASKLHRARITQTLNINKKKYHIYISFCANSV